MIMSAQKVNLTTYFEFAENLQAKFVDFNKKIEKGEDHAWKVFVFNNKFGATGEYLEWNDQFRCSRAIFKIGDTHIVIIKIFY